MAKVSAILTSHNYAAYLPAAIESVLSQTWRDFDLIVVDDGSTDNTERVMEKYARATRYVRQENQGVSIARNRGIQESGAQYVAFLDADDFWLPRKLELQLDALSRRPDCRVCYTAHRPFGPEFGPRVVGRCRGGRQPILERLIVSGNVIGSASTVLCERSLFSDVGGFDPELSDCADWDMWLRIASISDFAHVDESLVAYRRHDRNMTRNIALREKDSRRVLEKAFAMNVITPALRAQRRRVFARNHMILAGSYFHAGSYGRALRYALHAIALDVRQAAYPAAWPVRALMRVALRGEAV